MEASVYNLLMFLCCCCTKRKRHKITQTDKRRLLDGVQTQRTMSEDGDLDSKDGSQYLDESSMYESSVSGSGFYAAVGHEDRALDIIGFLGSDLFVDDPDAD